MWVGLHPVSLSSMYLLHFQRYKGSVIIRRNTKSPEKRFIDH